MRAKGEETGMMNRPDNTGPGPDLDPAYWGYILRAPAPGRSSARTPGVAGKIAGMLLILVAIALWLTPNALYAPDLIVMKLAATVLFLTLGGTLVWSTRKGFVDEVQVDRIRHELRFGLRNGHGEFRQTETLRFSDVGSVLLVRPNGPDRPARLYLRLGRSDRALEAARGCEAALSRLRVKLIEDLGVTETPERSASASSPPRRAAALQPA